MGTMVNKLIMPRYDVAFKSIFKSPDNADVVEDFLKAVLDIPEEVALGDIVVTDPELLPESEGEKLSILDVSLRVPGMGFINVEMQISHLSDMTQRMLHLWARMAAKQVQAGGRYKGFNRVILIVITEFNIIGDDAYRHRFRLYDKDRDIQLTDLAEFDILELKKLPRESDRSRAWDWARFFGSRTDDELREAAGRSEGIGKAMMIIEKLSADEAARYKAEREETMLLDHLSRMDYAESKGRAEGEAKARAEAVANLRATGMSDAEIAAATKYDPELIASIPRA
jgi:predicted transposase/invertase (TIGR01784 family)